MWVLRICYKRKVWQSVEAVSSAIGQRPRPASPFKPRKTRRWARHRASFQPASHRAGTKNRWHQTSRLRSLTQTNYTRRQTKRRERTKKLRIVAIMISWTVSMTLILVAYPVDHRPRIRRSQKWLADRREVLCSSTIAKGIIDIWSPFQWKTKTRLECTSQAMVFNQW